LPHLLRLSTGEILLSHRLPKTELHISRDETKTWQGPYSIDDCIGAYPSTVELKDGSVLIVYYVEGPGSVISRQAVSTEGQRNRIPTARSIDALPALACQSSSINRA